MALKINKINIIFIVIAVVITAAIVIKIIRYRPSERFYYSASVCAPSTFPVYVRELYFLTGNNETVHVDTEDVNYFKSDWKKDHHFPETTEPQLLPQKLVLKYASFREGSFYNDTIVLPFHQLKSTFDSLLAGKQGIDIHYRGQTKKGLVFLVGIANNGNIIVWLKDDVSAIEIARTKIKAKPPGDNDTYWGEEMSASAYLEDRFSLLGDSLKTLIRSGYDADASYIDSATSH